MVIPIMSLESKSGRNSPAAPDRLVEPDLQSLLPSRSKPRHPKALGFPVSKPDQIRIISLFIAYDQPRGTTNNTLDEAQSFLIVDHTKWIVVQDQRDLLEVFLVSFYLDTNPKQIQWQAELRHKEPPEFERTTANKMALIWALLVVTAAVIQAAPEKDERYYILVAPEKLRPFSKYEASVTVIGTDKPVDVKVSIVGTDETNKDFVKSVTVNVPPNKKQAASFKIDELKCCKYNLTIEGDENFKFENQTELTLIEKHQSIFIQTDRAMYKPGHKVQFRTLVLDMHLTPSTQNKIDVILKDGQNNRVKEWKNVQAVKGVYSNEIQLSSQPVLGDWTIIVKSGREEKSKTFTVAEYVLPKFEVKVDLPDYATIANSKIPVGVSAKYTYGQLVKGEATVKVKLESYADDLKRKEISKQIKVDPVGNTEVDLGELIDPDTSRFMWSTKVVVDVEFKEDLTGKVINGSGSTTLHKHDFQIFFLNNETQNIVPGQDYKAKLKVVKWDNTPYVGPKGEKVKVRQWGMIYHYQDQSNITWDNEYDLPTNGELELSFPTDENTHHLNIEAQYRGQSAYSYGYRNIPSPIEEKKNASVEIILKDESHKIGDILPVDIVVSGSPKYLSYYIIGRELIDSDTIELKDGQNSTHLDLKVTQSMVPSAHLLVSYISNEGEVFADKKYISVENYTENFIKIRAAPDDTEPGKETAITVETKPNSLVGLMGVDQSVLLLKSGNDFSESEIRQDLSAYDYQSYQGRYRRSSISPYWRSSSTKYNFNSAGAVVLTNAQMYEEPYVPFGPFPVSGVMVGPPSPVAAFGAPGSAAHNPSLQNGDFSNKRSPVTVRSKFPETWIWDIFDSSNNGIANLTKSVPDTITSWVISGFSLSPEYGLALSTDPAKVRVFRPFFVSLNLPYSVKRGESMVVPVNVFNYMDQNVTASITLHNPGWFSFAAGGEKKSKREVESSRTKSITIGPNSAGSADFVIKPEKIGYMEVKAIATSAVAGDGVSRKLLVKPEGITQYKSKGVLIDLREKREFRQDVELAIPEDAVPDSAMVEVSAVGDLLGSALDNLDKLIRQPYGCGEQNMLNFVPNIVILDYLKNSKQLTDSIESTALKYLDMGYQRELTYKHDDNSYSAFGKSDDSGSTWLTAFVAKSFKQAKKFSNIEDSAIIDPLRWLASKQNENGSFSEVGHVSHKSMQGGGSGGLALTAYVLTAFVESLDMTDEFKGKIDKTAKYLEEQIAKGSADVYSTAVAAYALGLADLPSKEKAFQLMESKAIINGDLKHWENEKDKEDEDKKEKYPWEEATSNAISVEITAYAMLCYLQRNMTAEAIPILKWLLSQQNSNGGFASTQDTVVALGAIGKLANQLTGNSKDMTIKFDYPPGGSTELKVTDANSLLYQKAELPSRKVRQVSIDAKGTGFAVVQVSYRFNVDKKGTDPAFKLNIETDSSTTKDHMILNICTSYTAGKESNMAVMEVTLPSGFTIDEDGIKLLRVTPRVKKVETKEENTLVVLYFDKVTNEDLCVPVSAYKTFRVAKQKPVPVTVYDYYDTTKSTTDFYSPKPSSVCDICEGDDCKNCDNDV
ncbi:hypothetical protein GE061_003841 [Apolygus lucorum]|uniref:TEP1-F n=1 Tax=Apolygus lucorum TaxID=248454 RepID=A0A8S9X361_APOLU|nr:hypothetical protein GE061_003841 [Apolygus lucorum]